jgi:hypothetical protein
VVRGTGSATLTSIGAELPIAEIYRNPLERG